MLSADMTFNHTMTDMVSVFSVNRNVLEKPTFFDDSERDIEKSNDSKYNPTAFIKYENKEKDEIETENKNKISFHSHPISDNYIQFNTKNLVRDLIVQFSGWEKTEDLESIIYISNIKDSLDYYREYLDKKSENRIFLSIMDLVFENNDWMSLPMSRVAFMKKELERFLDDGINKENLNVFAKQLYRNKISFLNES